METQFSANLWLNKSKANKAGDATIYLRVTRAKRKIEVATGKFVNPIYWNSKKGQVATKCPDAQTINDCLTDFKRKVAQVKSQLLHDDKYYDLNKIKDLISPKSEASKSLIEAIAYHNQNMQTLVGRTISPNTLKSYIFFLQKIQRFMKIILNRHDILLKDLDHLFLERFKNFLIAHDKNRPNTVLKNIVLLRRIINMSLEFDWIDKDEPIRTYLNAEELAIIETTVTDNKSLTKIRDMFIFQCYTGLGFIDLINLQWKYIVTDAEKREWIKMNRQKTSSYFAVPLLPPATKILLRYPSHGPDVFPKISNQKYNAGLKKLMKLCDIQKQIASHSGRRTFATTVTLSNGIPIETVSRMLGHSDLKVTQIYAKVIDKKIMDDMQGIMND